MPKLNRTQSAEREEALAALILDLDLPEEYVHEIDHTFGRRGSNRYTDQAATVLHMTFGDALYIECRITADVAPKTHRTHAGKTIVDIDGTVAFNRGDGWRSFDRVGVESSFYWDTTDDVSLEDTLAAQIARGVKARDDSRTRHEVPGTTFQLTDERLAELKQQLADFGRCSLTPSGFGTGFTFSTARPRGAYVTAGTEAQRAFFDVDALWVESFDCD